MLHLNLEPEFLEITTENLGAQLSGMWLFPGTAGEQIGTLSRLPSGRRLRGTEGNSASLIWEALKGPWHGVRHF